MRQFNSGLYLASVLVVILCCNVSPSSQCGKGRGISLPRNRKYKENCCFFKFRGIGKACKKSCVGYVCYDDWDCSYREYCTLSKRCAPKVRPKLRLKTTVAITPRPFTTLPVKECFRDSDCSTTGYCCILSYSGPVERVCQSSCVGYLCSPENADCGSNEECVDHKCKLVNRPNTPTTVFPTTTSKARICDEYSHCVASGGFCCIVDWTREIQKECKSSCVGNHCYEDSDCGLNEHCRNLRCEPGHSPTVRTFPPTRDMSKCSEDSGCVKGKYCCIVDWSRAIQKECKSSCVGDLCYEDSNCGLNENCISSRCVLASTAPMTTLKINTCAQDSHCARGKYCCIVDWTREIQKECKSSCVGNHCYEDSDCALNETCNYDLKCELESRPSVGTVSPNPCSRDSDCTKGNFCCIVDWRGLMEKKCKASCVGDLCYEDSDCGMKEFCTSHSHCNAI
ncbi:neurogenic locus notch homolog protein 1-like isoform X1 [Dendronephthya gigantea]|uniref:neurogenic locus notch homolog protein 1-like isoform X1 n=1 Tax=Dendronephthya gigantea TaxID=151771 RepID=UPI00106D7685|nr:neurogenic locus notch homolog protein 1-like isoform X1 [Dendronephthya gigantea]